MLFSSGVFLFYFLPLFLLAYTLSPKSFKNYLVLIASIFFYSWGGPTFVFILLSSTVIDFFIVRRLHETNDSSTRKKLLFSSIFLNVGLLLYFKYANFFVENVNQAFAFFGGEEVGWTDVMLPIGISFYTFQTLTYSIDVYRKKHEPLAKLSDYLLYIMSFPQMIAGPIVRFSSIADQITSRPDTWDDKLNGFYRFALGLAKKVIIANAMGAQADRIFSADYESLSALDAWTGLLAYTFQIYFDFAGYSSMAIGLGRMIGFTFPENFNSPYISATITEFWRRWHITLGAFMRDYLYIPLGGNRVSSKSRLYANLALVFLISGLWHGASWNFILWGGFHGALLIMDRLFLADLLQRVGRLPALVLTFFFVNIGWVLFRIEETAKLGAFYRALFSAEGTSSIDALPGFNVLFMVAVVFAFFAFHSKGAKLSAAVYEKQRVSIKTHIGYLIVTGLLFVLSAASVVSSDFNPFIYFRF